MWDSRARVLGVAIALAACGDNTPPRSTASLPRITVTAPVSTTPSASLSAHVEIAGDVRTSELVIRATEPGPPLVADLPRFVESGVAPPTGPVHYLAADGTWSDNEVVYASAPATADVALTWPTATPGQWQLTAIVREIASQLPQAVDQSRVLVATGPALALSIDRLWLNLGDLEHVAVQVAGSPSDARLVSWLTLPDGSQLALPYLTPYLPPGGTLGTTGQVTLIDRDLASHGPGDYQVATRLIDPTTGTILAAGGAGFTVCASQGTIAGSVLDENGAPLGGGASTAIVQLVSLQQGGTAKASVDASGHYTATVPVGHWLIEATVVDAAGQHDVPLQAVTIGCAGPVALDLHAGAAAARRRPVSLGLDHAQPIDAAPATPAGGCTPDPIVVLVQPDYSAVGTNKTATDKQTVRVTPGLRDLASPDQVKFVGSAELQAALASAARQMALGCDTCTGDDMRIVLDVARTLQAVDFILSVSVTGPDQGPFRIKVAVIDVAAGNEVDSTFAQATLANLNTQVDSAINELSAGLVRELRSRARPIKYPKFAMSTDPPRPRHNDAFTVSTVVTDTHTCVAAPSNTPITLTEVANTPPAIAPTPLRTDSQGVANTTVTIASAPIATFRATFDDGVHHAQGELVVPFDSAGIDGMAVGADRVTLAFGERAHGVIDYTGHPNAMLTLTAVNGSVDQPTVMTDGNGHAAFVFTAGSSGGVASVHITDAGGEEDADFWVEAPLKITVDAAPEPKVLVQQQLPITATVQLANGQPAVGQPIIFTITSGLGVLSHATATTDDQGRAAIVFTAPTSSGTTTIEASGAIGTARVASSIDIEVRDPCVNCPVVITTDMDTSVGPHVAKGGTANMFANQIVSWSVNAGGGSINSSGRLTGGSSGGIYTVKATSLENPGQTATFDFTVDCDENELGSAHAPTQAQPVLGGGTSYPINQTAGVGDGCTSSGASTLILYAPAYWDMTTSQGYKHVDVGLPGVCSTLVTDTTHPPTLQGCTINYRLVDNVSGCPIQSVRVVVSRGPGIGGFAGHFEKRQGDATCTILESVDLASP